MRGDAEARVLSAHAVLVGEQPPGLGGTMRRSSSLLAGLAGALVLTLAALTAPAAVAGAPVATAPAYSVAEGDLDASLTCDGDPTTGPTPVLLVPGTTLTPDLNFSWNYARQFTRAGRSWCWVELPGHAMRDIQVAGEYVAHAIRTLHEAAGRPISIVGFSQGGMVPRWALKYWPDTRAMVDDLIGLDPSNHGTLDAYPVCLVGCAPALWQQRTGSAFLRALNADAETWAGISYSQVFTATDEIVVPNIAPFASSALSTGEGEISNVLVQSICPVHVSDHLSMGTSDPVGHALVLDALTHDGPADPARISRAVCLRALAPGISPASFASNFTRVLAVAATQLVVAPRAYREPELADYAR
ncbi:MAG: lipase [Actinobacteria bacterium]|nr:lipase [Actinomycetota bacterium]